MSIINILLFALLIGIPTVGVIAYNSGYNKGYCEVDDEWYNDYRKLAEKYSELKSRYNDAGIKIARLEYERDLKEVREV